MNRSKPFGEKVLLAGDFNAKLDSLFVPGDVYENSTNGKYLLDLTENSRSLLIKHTELYTWCIIYTCQ